MAHWHADEYAKTIKVIDGGQDCELRCGVCSFVITRDEARLLMNGIAAIVGEEPQMPERPHRTLIASLRKAAVAYKHDFDAGSRDDSDWEYGDLLLDAAEALAKETQ